MNAEQAPIMNTAPPDRRPSPAGHHEFLLVACEAIDGGEAALQPTVDVAPYFRLCQRLAEINGLNGINVLARAVCKMPGAQLSRRRLEVPAAAGVQIGERLANSLGFLVRSHWAMTSGAITR
jgi:hypothetical protein